MKESGFAYETVVVNEVVTVVLSCVSLSFHKVHPCYLPYRTVTGLVVVYVLAVVTVCVI